MSKNKTYWVTTTRIKINEIEKYFIYGDEFPDLEDKKRMKRLFSAKMISTIKPRDIPNPPKIEINHFKLSQPYEKLEVKEVGSNKKKNKEDK